MKRRMPRTLLTGLIALLIPAASITALTLAGPAGAADPQPSAVSVPGSFGSEVGCPGDWQPDCAAAAADPAGQRRRLVAHPDAAGGQLRVQGGAEQELRRQLRQGRRARRRQHPAHRAGRRQERHVLLRQRHPLGDRRPQRPRSSPPPATSSPSWAARPTGRRTACGPGCRTWTATAPTPSPPPRSRRATTRSRPPSGCPGTSTTAPAGCPAGPTSRSRSARAGEAITLQLRLDQPPADGADRRRGCRDLTAPTAYWLSRRDIGWALGAVGRPSAATGCTTPRRRRAGRRRDRHHRRHLHPAELRPERPARPRSRRSSRPRPTWARCGSRDRTSACCRALLTGQVAVAALDSGRGPGRRGRPADFPACWTTCTPARRKRRARHRPGSLRPAEPRAVGADRAGRLGHRLPATPPPPRRSARVALPRGRDGVWSVHRPARLAQATTTCSRSASTFPRPARSSTTWSPTPTASACRPTPTRSLLVDLSDPGLKPAGWRGWPSRALPKPESTSRSPSCTSVTSRSATRPCRPPTAAPTPRSPTARATPSAPGVAGQGRA